MNNQLAVKSQNGRIAASETDALIASLPKWLAYLVGAFPAANVNKMTFLAYETAFSEADPALMLTAVQAVAKTHRYATFPTIAEINQAVTFTSQRAELEMASERGAVLRLRGLQQMRQALLQRAYRGDVDARSWESLISQYTAVGYEFNADWARRKLAQFQEAYAA